MNPITVCYIQGNGVTFRGTFPFLLTGHSRGKPGGPCTFYLAPFRGTFHFPGIWAKQVGGDGRTVYVLPGTLPGNFSLSGDLGKTGGDGRTMYVLPGTLPGIKTKILDTAGFFTFLPAGRGWKKAGVQGYRSLDGTVHNRNDSEP